jgi:transketolase
MGHSSLEEKFRSFGWGARTIDGHDMGQILGALSEFPFTAGRPSVLIAKTKMGLSFIENDPAWHYRKISREDLNRALIELDELPVQGD